MKQMFILVVMGLLFAGCEARQVAYQTICKSERGRQAAELVAGFAVEAVAEKADVEITDEMADAAIEQAVEQGCKWLAPSDN